MKITGGVYRGRNIKTPKGSMTRPTSAMIREVIFNILAHDVADAAFLDLFAGSGSVGLEAFSRGAETVTFVENHKATAAIIKENLQTFGVTEDYLILPAAATSALEKFKREKRIFDIIFLDPPFADEISYEQVLDNLADIVNDTGVIIAQHDKRLKLREEYTRIEQARTKIIGDNGLTFYKKK